MRLLPNRTGNSSGHCVGQKGMTRWLLHCVPCCLTSLSAVSSWISKIVSVTGKLASLSGQGYCQSSKQVYTVAPWYHIIEGSEIANWGIFRDSLSTFTIEMRMQNKIESLVKSLMFAWGTHISGGASSLLYQPSPPNKSRCKHQKLWMKNKSCWPNKWSYSQKTHNWVSILLIWKLAIFQGYAELWTG